MARLSPLWQQNNSYPASTDRVLLGTLWPTSGSSGGAVQTVTNTMQVQILAGTAAVALTGSNYTALCRWDATENVTLTAAPPAGQSRIDVIVLQVRDATIDAGANNDFIFQAIAGTPATTGSQVAPAVPNNAYALAQLTVPGGAANLNGVTVTDRRASLGIQGGLSLLQVGANTTQTISGNAAPVLVTAWNPTPVVKVGAGTWAANQFTAGQRGLYRVHLQLGWNLNIVQSGNFAIQGAIRLNGANLAIAGSYIVSLSAGTGGYCQTGKTLTLNAGDVVDFAAYASGTTNNYTLLASAGDTFAEIQQLPIAA